MDSTNSKAIFNIKKINKKYVLKKKKDKKSY